jgi:hypothetical protein
VRVAAVTGGSTAVGHFTASGHKASWPPRAWSCALPGPAPLLQTASIQAPGIQAPGTLGRTGGGCGNRGRAHAAVHPVRAGRHRDQGPSGREGRRGGRKRTEDPCSCGLTALTCSDGLAGPGRPGYRRRSAMTSAATSTSWRADSSQLNCCARATERRETSCQCCPSPRLRTAAANSGADSGST